MRTIYSISCDVFLTWLVSTRPVNQSGIFLANIASGRWLYVLTFCLFSTQLQAQSSKSTVNFLTPVSQEEQSKLSARNTSKLAQVKQPELHKQVQLVKVGNLAKIQKKGVLSFTVPGAQKSVTFYAGTVEAASEDDFKWIGTSADKLSTAIFISKQGKVYGSFNINNQYFQLFSAEDGLSILIEDRNDLNLSCPSEGHTHSIPKDTIQEAPKRERSGNRAGVCTEPMRVLVLFTQNAVNSVPDINATIDLSIQQYNTTLDNSGIGGIPQTNRLQLAGSQLITFAGNGPEDIGDIEVATRRVRDNATVQNLRNQFNADLVVCLVERVYQGDAVGSVATIPANNGDYCAVVRAPFSSSAGFFTFTHEVGHLLGGRHQDDPGGPAYAHGFRFTLNPPATPNQARTIMHTFESTSTRIMYFSSPNVSINGSPTGTFATNHVARRISEVSVNVVNFRPSVTQPFNAVIDGPTYISQFGMYTWELLTFCRNFLTTEWQVSTDGFNYGPPMGAGDALSFYTVDETNNGSLYIRCTIVTDQSQTYVTTTQVTVNICPGCRTSVAAGEETNITGLSAIFPNPANNELTVSYFLNELSEVEVEFVDMMGKSKLRKLLGKQQPGTHQAALDVSPFAGGMYVCRLKLGNQVMNKTFFVSK